MLVRFQTDLFSEVGWAAKRFVQFGHRQCPHRCGNPRNGAAVSMAWFPIPELMSPGCQVDHTPEWQPHHNALLCVVLAAPGPSTTGGEDNVLPWCRPFYTTQKSITGRRIYNTGALLCCVEKTTAPSVQWWQKRK